MRAVTKMKRLLVVNFLEDRHRRGRPRRAAASVLTSRVETKGMKLIVLINRPRPRPSSLSVRKNITSFLLCRPRRSRRNHTFLMSAAAHTFPSPASRLSGLTRGSAPSSIPLVVLAASPPVYIAADSHFDAPPACQCHGCLPCPLPSPGSLPPRNVGFGELDEICLAILVCQTLQLMAASLPFSSFDPKSPFLSSRRRFPALLPKW